MLDDVLGKKRISRASIENIRNATVEELAQAPSMNRAAAEKVYAFLHNPPAVEK